MQTTTVNDQSDVRTRVQLLQGAEAYFKAPTAPNDDTTAIRPGELRDILLDQHVEVSPSATLIELTLLTQEELGVDTAPLGLQATVARFAPPRSAREAARELRRSLRGVRRNVRRELSGWERARGLLSLRSLGLS